MPRKKKPVEDKPVKLTQRQRDAYIGGAGTVVDEPITVTLEKNYMPYAMSVIVSRAFPKSTASSPPTASFFIPCTRWGF